MNMKKVTFALAAALALSSTSAFATQSLPAEQQGANQAAGELMRPAPGHEHTNPDQPSHPGKHKAGQRAEGFTQELNLSKEQRRVLHQTMRDEMGQQKLIVSRYLEKLPAAEREALAADLKASHDQQVAKFLSVLTPEQKDQALAAFKQFSHGPGHYRGLPPARGDAPVAVQLPANHPVPAQLPAKMPVPAQLPANMPVTQ